MTTRLRCLMPVLCAVLWLPGQAAAESHEAAAELPPIAPVEIFACNFREGQSPADLDKVVREFDDWLDDRDVENYYAALLTPQFYGQRNFDVGWFGAWADGTDMGGFMETWLERGGAIGARFAEVIDCASHTLFASMTIRPPATRKERAGDRFVLSFANCSAREGYGFDEILAGFRDRAAYQAANGFENSTWILFPVYGEADAAYDFKLVEGHADYAAFGSDFERMGNGGHWRGSGEAIDAMLDCDIPESYDGRTVRIMRERR